MITQFTNTITAIIIGLSSWTCFLEHDPDNNLDNSQKIESLSEVNVNKSTLLAGTSMPGSTGWRGPARDGVYPETGLLAEWPAGGPPMLWKYDHLGDGFSSPVLSGERILTAGTLDSITDVFSYDKMGSLIWIKPLGPDWTGEYPHKNSTTVGTPVYRDGYLFSLDGTESVLIKVTDGKEPEMVWTNPGFFPLQGDAILIGDRLYGKSKKNAIACLDWATGKEIATFPWKSMVITLISAEGLI